MRIQKLGNMVKGWFVGDFMPTVLRTSAVEVAIKEYPAGFKEARHYHRIATELTAIVRGRALMNGHVLNVGDIVSIDPGESAEFESLEATMTVVVKIPGATDDKYLC